MSDGLVALGGALLGGAGTLVGAWITQERLDRRDEKKQVEERAKEAERAADAERTAARILQEDLAWADARIKLALDNEAYWSARYGLKRESWLQRRDQMAVALTDAQWMRVREGFHALQALELQAAKGRKDEFTRLPVSSWGMKQLRAGRVQVQAAIETLAPVAEDRPRQTFGVDPEEDEELPAINPDGDF